MRERAQSIFTDTQTQICTALEALDGGAEFGTESWSRPETDGAYGGGGITRVLKQGRVFEQAGVNFSAVEGTLPEVMVKKLLGRSGTERFFATGVSLVLHPFSPMVPTVHANFRYLEVAEEKWFGGGADLTPYVLFEEDAVHFHETFKAACDSFDREYFPCFKRWCDEYFYLPHRKETRGVGGIFFDYLGRTIRPESDRESSDERAALGRKHPLDRVVEFVEAAAAAFVPAYVPIAARRKDLGFGEGETAFQLLRRGRYAEFNLLYDRGTQFGLATGGRVESILMSLPPRVRWEYEAPAPSGPRLLALLDAVRMPRDWIPMS